MNGDSADVLPQLFHLAGMKSRADVQAQPTDGLDDGTSATNGASWTVKRDQEPIAGRMNLAPAEVEQFTAYEAVVSVQQLPPAAVAKGRRLLSRSDDVGKQHGSEHAVGLNGVADSGEQLFDLVEDDICVTDPGVMVRPWQFDVVRPGDALGQVSPVADIDPTISSTV